MRVERRNVMPTLVLTEICDKCDVECPTECCPDCPGAFCEVCMGTHDCEEYEDWED